MLRDSEKKYTDITKCLTISEVKKW
jgi:hypothetical protein